MRIYVASSWRNLIQPDVVTGLRQGGHEVYDFRNPKPGDNGFQWAEIDPAWESWSHEAYIKALAHPIAELGFRSDIDALEWAEVVVLLLPCGRSAHSEAGFHAGRGKPVIVWLGGGLQPELMYKIFYSVRSKWPDVLADLRRLEVEAAALRAQEASDGD